MIHKKQKNVQELIFAAKLAQDCLRSMVNNGLDKESRENAKSVASRLENAIELVDPIDIISE